MPAPRDLDRLRRRVRLLAVLTGLCLAGSTGAFAQGAETIGAVLGVAAGLTSAAMVWSWIRTN